MYYIKVFPLFQHTEYRGMKGKTKNKTIETMKAKQLKQLKNYLIVNKSMKLKQLKNSWLGLAEREKGAAKRE